MDISYAIPSERFARCIASSKRVCWDIETDVIRDRRFDRANKFLPDGLTLAGRLDFLSPGFLRGYDPRTIYVFLCPITRKISYVGRNPAPFGEYIPER
jgi:hypothetical protein